MPIDAFIPELQDRIVCAIAAAGKYRVPANIVLAVAEKEGGKPGQWRPNKDGTQDVGSMQFNTAYLNDLARYGITASDVATAGCYSFDLAAWRLRQHLYKDKGDLWTRAANYHSRTPRYNQVYRADLIQKAAKWADWLDTRFVIFDTSKASIIPPFKHSTSVTGSGVRPPNGNKAVIAAPDSGLNASRAEFIPRTIIVKSSQ